MGRTWGREGVSAGRGGGSKIFFWGAKIPTKSKSDNRYCTSIPMKHSVQDRIALKQQQEGNIIGILVERATVSSTVLCL